MVPLDTQIHIYRLYWYSKNSNPMFTVIPEKDRGGERKRERGREGGVEPSDRDPLRSTVQNSCESNGTPLPLHDSSTPGVRLTVAPLLRTVGGTLIRGSTGVGTRLSN